MQVLILIAFTAAYIEAKQKAKEAEIKHHTKSVMKQIKNKNLNTSAEMASVISY